MDTYMIVTVSNKLHILSYLTLYLRILICIQIDIYQ